MTLASALPRSSSTFQADERVRSAIRRHYDGLWRFLRRMGVAEQDAADAAQAVLLVFSQRIDAVEHGAERPFLLGTARRVAADYRKRGHRVHEVAVGGAELVGLPHPGPGTEEQADQRRLLAHLDRVLARLHPELREVFVLSELEEMTMGEIAALLGIPPGTVASRLRRARELFATEAAALRRRLDEEIPR
jgi:RNA polymerase sigma-70 factor (ECF subfamily)